MTSHDLRVVATSVMLALSLYLLAMVLRLAIASRPKRPPPPDTFLPEGWQHWHPDGHGTMRLYEWHQGAWREVRGRGFKVAEEEPADS